MSGVGFSVFGGSAVGVELHRIYDMFEFQQKHAAKALQHDKMAAVAHVFAAFVAKGREVPNQKQLDEWTKEIQQSLNLVTPPAA